ncbi:MAG: hypothetical protein N2376_10590, partial [Clostridia bacterium]|nr:hypothetical protein [Clostridia bacterium]
LYSHIRYEQWVINVHKRHHEFRVDHGGLYLRSITLYVCMNSRKAIQTYKRYSQIKDRYDRFYKITSVILVMAQRTTAGLMHMFFKDMQRFKPKTLDTEKKQPVEKSFFSFIHKVIKHPMIGKNKLFKDKRI